MNYLEALNYLYIDRNFSKIRPGLERVRKFLDYLGNPQKSYEFAHVTGTNGKGSTSNFLFELLKSTGMKVGLYTSPHFVTFRERIKINDEMVGKDYVRDFVKSTIPIIRKMDAEGRKNMLTFFEITTAMAFEYFKDMNVDFVVLEVGLGGRFDATNVIDKPVLSVITNVDFDHTKILGNTLESIAFEKAGIIKGNSKVVTGETKERALKIIKEGASRKKANVYRFGEDFGYKDYSLNVNSNEFDYLGLWRNLYNLKISMNGEHQLINCSIALASFEIIVKELGLKFSENGIRNTLKKVKWPGRFEVMHLDSKEIVLDGAHNPAGILSLKKSLEIYYPQKKKIAVLGILDDKDYKKMITEINDVFSEVILTKPVSYRTSNINEILGFLKILRNKNEVEYIENPIKAFKKAFDECREDCIIVVAGSLYLVGYLRDYLIKVGQGV